MYIIYGETDHQPRLNAWDKRSDLVHWEDLEGSGGEGGGRGIGMENTCKSMDDSFQCMTKPTTIKKEKRKKKKKYNLNLIGYFAYKKVVSRFEDNHE